MKRSDAFPSHYISKDDVTKPIIAKIDSVRFETIKGEHGEDDKPVMYFRDGVKPMVLNLINWTTVEDTYGPESDDWAGKSVELYIDPGVMFGGKRVGGVRIRIPKDTIGMTLEQANAVQIVLKSGDSTTIGQLDATKLQIILDTPNASKFHEPARIRLEALKSAVEL